MSILSVILLVMFFCIVQGVLFRKAKKKYVKYMPAFLSMAGIAIGLLIYLISYIPYILKMYSQSVLSENQYFAVVICVLFMPCFIGSLFGIIVSKFLDRRFIENDLI